MNKLLELRFPFNRFMSPKRKYFETFIEVGPPPRRAYHRRRKEEQAVTGRSFGWLQDGWFKGQKGQQLVGPGGQRTLDDFWSSSVIAAVAKGLRDNDYKNIGALIADYAQIVAVVYPRTAYCIHPTFSLLSFHHAAAFRLTGVLVIVSDWAETHRLGLKPNSKIKFRQLHFQRMPKPGAEIIPIDSPKELRDTDFALFVGSQHADVLPHHLTLLRK